MRATFGFLLLLLLPSLSTSTAEAGGTVRVGARVLPFLISSVAYDTETIDVDEKRRTVTVTGRAMVVTNDPAGYLVVFEPNAKMVRSAEVEGFSVPLRTGAAPAFTHESLTTTKIVVRAIRVRLDLHEDAKPGRYPLPFILSIRQMTPSGF